MRAAVFSTALLCAGGLVAGCTAKTAAAPQPKIGMVAGVGGLADHSFNAAALAGLEECRRETGVGIAALSPQNSAEYAPKLTLLATENFDLVVAVGAALGPDVAKVARRFQNTHFALIDGIVDEPNVASLTFAEQDASFLAGALAALVSKTKSVAFLGGAQVARLEPPAAGFIAGARQIDPHVRVLLRYVGSFDDPGTARSIANALYGQHADIIFAVAGRSNFGAIAAARALPSAYVIGVDADQDALAPGRILTSVVKRVDAAALRACREASSQKPSSGHVVLGLADGAIGLTNFTYTRRLVGDANLARLARIRRALVAGSLRAPASFGALKTFRPVSIR